MGSKVGLKSLLSLPYMGLTDIVYCEFFAVPAEQTALLQLPKRRL